MKDIETIYKEWLSLLPLNEKKQAQLARKFTVEYNYNSNHIEGNTLTYGQTELLLLFGKVSGEAEMKDFEDMKASNVGLKMMTEEAKEKQPLTETFIRQLHHTLLREDYTVYKTLPGGIQTSFVVHAGQYKTRPNSVITRYGDRFEYASPEETPALMNDLIKWYNEAEESGKYKRAISIKTVYESPTERRKRWFVKAPRHTLPHLLEKPHKTRNGGTSRAFPHIKENEEKAVKDFESKVEGVIKSGGR